MENLSRHGRRRLVAAAVVAVGALLAVAAIALAAKPAKGKTYSGVIGTGVTSRPISFKVAKSGKKVGKFSLPSGYPIYCQGGGFGTARSKGAKISKRGTFKARLPIVFTPTHSHQGFVKISGKFKPNKHESGKVTTAFTTNKSCNGKTKYSTQAG